jgi:hypothetical protein
MTIESQAQSKRSTNLKLSAWMVTFIKAVGRGKFAMPIKRKSLMRTFEALRTRNLVEATNESTVRYLMVQLTPAGCDVFDALIKAEAPVESAAPADELPAKMPLPAIVDEDTMPVMDVVTVDAAYAIDDHVTFNYFRDPNYQHEVYQGRIMERAFDRLCGWMYRIDPAPCAFHLSPRWISERYVRTTLTGEMVAGMVATDHANALYDAMERAKQVYMDYARRDTWRVPANHTTYLCKVSAHIAFLRAQAAYTGVRNEAMIAYLYGAQNAPQTPQNGPSAVVDDVQAFSANLDQRRPENASEPFAPVNATNDHPLALIQPGSVAAKTDWDALKVKRDGQYAEAYERVYGAPPAPKKTTREPLPRVRAYRKENAAEIMETTKRIMGQ